MSTNFAGFKADGYDPDPSAITRAMEAHFGSRKRASLNQCVEFRELEALDGDLKLGDISVRREAVGFSMEVRGVIGGSHYGDETPAEMIPFCLRTAAASDWSWAFQDRLMHLFNDLPGVLISLRHCGLMRALSSYASDCERDSDKLFVLSCLAGAAG